MIDRILLILADNAAGLEARQLQAALGVEAFPRDELGTLIADGRAVLDTTSGVDVYRLGTPKASEPKTKAAPTSRMVPIALLDALALAVGVPMGTSIVDMCYAIEAERATGIANHRALQRRSDAAAAVGVSWVEDSGGVLRASVPFACPEVITVDAPSTAYTPPTPWVASYSYDDGNAAAYVKASGKRWEWAVDDGGTGEAATLEKAIRIADAVRALS